MQIKTPSKSVSESIDPLKTKCPSKCGWKGMIYDLDTHLNDNCPSVKMKCPHCGRTMKRIDFSLHETRGCPREQFSCNKCEMPYTRQHKRIHNVQCQQKWLYEKGNMPNEQRNFVAKALKYCQQQSKLNGVEIKNTLKHQGMNAIVIEGDSKFAWYSGATPITYSQWDCDGSIFSIMCLRYSSYIDQISCSDQGSMSSDEISFIHNVLNHCSQSDEMRIAEIRDELKVQGMKAIVIKEDGGVVVPDDEDWTWSEWKSTKYGLYTIINMQYQAKINRITLMESNITQELAKIIGDTLAHCSEQQTMKVTEITEALLNEGVKAIVFKTHKQFAFAIELTQIRWSRWKSTKYGYYTIIMLQYLTIKHNEIERTGQGDMKDDEEKVVMEALKYCDEQNTMTATSVKDQLEHLGMKSIVIQDAYDFDFNGVFVWQPFTYSEWNCSKYGRFAIIKIQYKPKDSDHIQCIDERSMNASDRKIVLKCLKYCLNRKRMRPDDISSRLKQQDVQNIVLKDCMMGSQNYIKGKTSEISTWKISAFGLYHVIIFKETK